MSSPPMLHRAFFAAAFAFSLDASKQIVMVLQRPEVKP